MSIKEVKEKTETVIPGEGEQSGEKNDKCVDAFSDAKVKKEIIKKLNKKEAKMADKKEEGQDQVKDPESVLSESAVTEDIKVAESCEVTTGETSSSEGNEDVDGITDQENSDKIKDVKNTPTITDGKQKPFHGKQEVKLPDGVETVPRNEEEIDITTIQNSETLLDVYLNVSDDYGQMHGDLDLEKAVMGFNLKHRNLTVASIQDPKQILKESTELIKRYIPVLNKSGHIAAGIMTKYGIRLGMIFDIQKIAVRKLHINWTDWYKDNHSSMSLRSAQDYMMLAKIPGIIKYAFLGKERLVEICRVLEDKTVKDPFKSYLENKGVVFNPQKIDYEKVKDARKHVDGIIAVIQIKKAEEKKDLQLNVDEKIVRKLVNMGIDINNTIIEKLFLLKEYNKDFNANTYLVDVIQKGGAEDKLFDKVKKIKSLSKLSGLINSNIKFIKENPDFRNQVGDNTMEALEDSVREIKALIQAT